ncbi:unnamed protein product [Heligmosomoides polygyrus]|uniref:Pex2_Pex12 domain-containing protein n=1 Tax=Heligmosomoides polygyrus TaxID=6339 RepID=A0A3P7X954_HELPZ|nr:unnamed protein product [Heligmosomoides polygyrus]
MLSPASSEGDGQDEMTRLRHALQHVRHSPRKEHASPPIRIGVSSAEALQAAMVSRLELIDTMLPYILPFLRVYTNQSYLVSRISELVAEKFMMDYSWNSGGREPVQEKGESVWAADLVSFGRAARRPWGDHLSTDALLVFSLFSAYMDSQLTSNPLVVSCRLAQPFSAVYTLKTPQRPSPVHLAAESFYLRMVCLLLLKHHIFSMKNHERFYLFTEQRFSSSFRLRFQ